ncbi:hypothetical protein CR203_15210 [Salipaludibacillus neizhouensis]|uniref:Multidrug ABC transporter permease n=1 Tax=Salipaludibacillus neizhouensis TaxID=885475 RepID=A0A3A9K8D5_9BACI|nr:hypothetical protein [Salipaludibacillus neizhouensis]RKL66631.1 hypothetical protein CR203_15210 [Salipaludibacillus neizhouensis]
MKSKISLWNKALFNLQLRTVTWFGILLTLALLVMLPISIFVQEVRFGPESNLWFYSANSTLNTLSEFSLPFQLIVFAIFPVLLGIVLLNYSTKKEATYFMHSLPFTRQTLLTNTYLAGFVALLSPILITGIVLGILRFFLEDPFYSFVDLFAWIGLSTFILVFVFIVTMMIGILVGNGLLHGALTYTVIAVPALLIVLTLLNLQYFISGVALTSYTETLVTKGIFFVRLTDLYTNSFSILEYVIYIFIMVSLVLLSYLMYAKRPSEASDQAIVYPVVRSIFLYGLTYFAMLASGVYFTEALQGGFAWTMFGYVLGAFIAYTILQMILQKAIRLTWYWKGFLGYVVVIVLLMIPVNIGGGVYENKIPTTATVESVAIYSSYSYGNEESGEVPRLTDELSIEQVTELHKELKDYDHDDEEFYSWNTITFDYKLEDGSSLRREYSLGETGSKVTEDLRNNAEFKQAYDPIFQLNDLDVTYASIHGNLQGDEKRISDPEELQTLINLLEEDVTENPSQVLAQENAVSLGDLQFNIARGKDIHRDEYVMHDVGYVMLTKDHLRTINWLKENDYADSLLLSENIDSVTVVPSTGDDFYMEIDEVIYSSNSISDKFPDALVISEASEIEELLDAGQNHSNEDYVVIINNENDYRHYFFIDKEDIPDFVLEGLE